MQEALAAATVELASELAAAVTAAVDAATTSSGDAAVAVEAFESAAAD